MSMYGSIDEGLITLEVAFGVDAGAIDPSVLADHYSDLAFQAYAHGADCMNNATQPLEAFGPSRAMLMKAYFGKGVEAFDVMRTMLKAANDITEQGDN